MEDIKIIVSLSEYEGLKKYKEELSESMESVGYIAGFSLLYLRKGSKELEEIKALYKTKSNVTFLEMELKEIKSNWWYKLFSRIT